jgi:hypothetical protein
MMGHGYIFIFSFLSFLLAGMMSAFVHTSYVAFFFLLRGQSGTSCMHVAVSQLALPFFLSGFSGS